MGRHADDQRSRGIARWVVIGAAVVVILAAISVGYLIVVRNSDKSSAVCDSRVTVAVAAGPTVSPAVSSAISAYNAKAPVVRSLCVSATVTTVTDRNALAGLTGSWPSGAGAPPALWIPDDQAYLAALDATRPDVAAGHPTDPAAWSPVVLAVRNDDAAALGSLRWADLPAAVGSSGSAALPGNRHLVLALPDATTNPGTGLAGQSVVAATVGTTKAVTAADVTTAAAALEGLRTGSAPAGDTAQEALSALAAGTGNTTAVPVTEADLVAFDAAHGGTLAAVHPSGPAAGFQVITAPISGSWVNADLATAAADVEAFIADPAGQQILADAGWRTTTAKPSHPQAGVDTTAAVTLLPAAAPAVGDAIAGTLGGSGSPVTSPTASPSTSLSTDASTSGSTSTASGTVTSTTPTTVTTAVTTPSGTTTTVPTTPTTRGSTTPTTSASQAASGPVLTILIDRSADLGSSVGGKPLTDWVRQALTSATNGKITDTVGLWTSSGLDTPGGYAQVVSTGLVTGTVGAQTRSAALASAIDGLTPGGSRWIYGAIIAADASAVSGADAHRADRLVVITTGADSTPNTSRAKVINAVKSGAGTVRVDVIGLGTAVPATAFDQIAAAGGGTYVPVTDPSKLTQALTDLLTLHG
jgi:hypothetical protein